jgi:DNA-binding GntR family transcriptional regulator
MNNVTLARKPPTAQEAVLHALRGAIASGRLRPGQQIIQEDLSTEFGVSRVPLREALKILEGEGQVTYYPHRGYFVTELSVSDLLEVYRLRELLEAEALSLAVRKCSDAELDDIAVLLESVEVAAGAADIGAMTTTNRSFHFAMFDLAGLPRLSRLIRQLWDATDVYRTVYFHDVANRDRIQNEHRAILTALRNRNARELIELHAKHRANSVRVVQDVINQIEESS